MFSNFFIELVENFNNLHMIFDEIYLDDSSSNGQIQCNKDGTREMECMIDPKYCSK